MFCTQYRQSEARGVGNGVVRWQRRSHMTGLGANHLARLCCESPFFALSQQRRAAKFSNSPRQVRLRHETARVTSRGRDLQLVRPFRHCPGTCPQAACRTCASMLFPGRDSLSRVCGGLQRFTQTCGRGERLSPCEGRLSTSPTAVSPGKLL